MKTHLYPWYKHLSILMLLLVIINTDAMAQELHILSGTVKDRISNEPLPGTMVLVRNLNFAAIADEKGQFEHKLPHGEHILVLSFLGFKTIEQPISIQGSQSMEFFMDADGLDLQEVEILSTGYQEIPRERATGSFAHLDAELVQRRISTNILERLEDVTPGLIFNRDPASAIDPISIRGRSTIFGNVAPLIIIDNFPYDGPMENINPNDVETITVLKDAAAASIWGARAGNGVIVITTKSGRAGKGPSVSLISNLTTIEQPDLFYSPQMGIQDFIGVEKMLFDRGFYNAAENNPNRTLLSPAVETWIAQRNGLISEQEANSLIGQYRLQDVRTDLSEHYYRASTDQQYALQVNGGTNVHKYFFSAGYDKNLANIRGNSSDRITLNTRQNWSIANNKIDLGLGLYYSMQKNAVTTSLPSTFAYDRLADQNGNPLRIDQAHSRRFIDNLPAQGLLDWTFIPLDEIGQLQNSTVQNDLRLNAGFAYRITENLRAEILYQYWQNQSNTNNFAPEDLFNTRNLINQFTQVDTEGRLLRAIPTGGFLDVANTRSNSHNARGQLRYDRKWNDHRLDALAGYEIKEWNAAGYGTRFYGYDNNIGISTPVDYITRFRRYFNQGLMGTIPNLDSHFGTLDRFVSYFANAAYTFKNRYLFSFSARKDASNLFGVNANQKGVPLWSAGLSWTVSDEKFYNFDWIPYLRFRSTYGYNGNVDRRLSALTTIRYLIGGANTIFADLPYANLVNPPNPNLRWEKIQTINLGLDFTAKNEILSGGLEYFVKNGMDLIGDLDFPPSSGITRFRGNFADTRVNGLDFNLRSKNINRELGWTTDFFLSTINEKVTNYGPRSSPSSHMTSDLPLEGRPLQAIYSFAWAGLDGQNGDPLGFIDGEPSSNYAAIINNATMEEINFHGSKRPRVFGAVRNTFHWKNFNLSANISYRLKYFYRRESVDYQELLAGRISHLDYGERWLQPGDETSTQIPSMPLISHPQRGYFYRFSEVLVERGDHIRLQDIRLGYSLRKSNIPKLPFQSAELYGYANNLGIIWKASSDPLDPDFRTMRPLRSLAFGLQINF